MVWVERGLDLRVAPFMMAALSATVAGRIVIERTTGLRVRVDYVGLVLLVLGLVLALVGPGWAMTRVAAWVVCAVLLARPCADFLWAVLVLRRFVRKGELLSLVTGGEEAPPSEG